MYNKWLQLQSLARLLRHEISQESYGEVIAVIESKLDETHPSKLNVHNRRIV